MHEEVAERVQLEPEPVPIRDQDPTQRLSLTRRFVKMHGIPLHPLVTVRLAPELAATDEQ